MTTSTTDITPESAISLYLHNYIDLTDNFPNDIARLISEIHVINAKRIKYSRLGELYMNKYLNKMKICDNEQKEEMLNKIEHIFLEIEKGTDQTLEVSRSILEQIDLKNRQMDASYRLSETLNQNNQTNGATTSYSNSNNKNTGYNSSRHENSSNGRNSPAFHKEKDNSSANGKRIRRGSNKNNQDYGSGDDRSSTPVTNERATNSNTKRGNNKRGLKTANKSERRNKSSSYNNEDSQLNDDAYDPNEPTYCLCEQVSYGEMICCDNRNCSIEWFHFQCVSLTIKPKGRWFCPNCRGERSNVQRK